MKTHIVKRTKLAPIERTPTPHFPDIARSIACRLGYDDEHIVFEAVILDADHAGVGDGARKSPASLYRWFAKGKPHGDRLTTIYDRGLAYACGTQICITRDIPKGDSPL